MKRRTTDKMFADAREELRALERADRGLRRRAARDRADATRATTKADRVRELRKDRRERILKITVPERRCPCCSQVKLKSRAWVVLDDESKRLLSAAALEAGELWAYAFRKAVDVGVVCRACFAMAYAYAPDARVALGNDRKQADRRRSRERRDAMKQDAGRDALDALAQDML